MPPSRIWNGRWSPRSPVRSSKNSPRRSPLRSGARRLPRRSSRTRSAVDPTCRFDLGSGGGARLGARTARRPSKRPTGSSWNVTRDPDVVRLHVGRGGNVGLVCGPISGVAVIDADNISLIRDMSNAAFLRASHLRQSTGVRLARCPHDALGVLVRPSARSRDSLPASGEQVVH